MSDAGQSGPNMPRLPRKACFWMLSVMLISAMLAWGVKPRLQVVEEPANFETSVPANFGDWRVVPDRFLQVDVAQGVEGESDQPYDQTLMRTYENSSGDRVMLALAWGRRQRQDVKVHRPEVCYPAQGYTVRSSFSGGMLDVPSMGIRIPTVSMLAQGQGTYEAVRYWIRIGKLYDGDGLRARWYLLQEGLAGRIPDGVLVRASQRVSSPEQMARSEALIGEFLEDLLQATPEAARRLMVR